MERPAIGPLAGQGDAVTPVSHAITDAGIRQPTNLLGESAVSTEIARARVRKLFQFLDAFNQLQNPVIRQISEQPWLLWLRDLPDAVAITRPTPGDGDERFVFKVRRPTLTHCPKPADVLKDWLVAGWDQFGATPAVRPTRNLIGGEPPREADYPGKLTVYLAAKARWELETKAGSGEAKTVRFEDNPDRVAAFEAWKVVRNTWHEAEERERRALSLFERLYALHGQMEREAEKVELVVGDGILTWRVPEGGIRHPILLKRIELQFDPEIPEFTLADTDSAPELHTALFSASERVDGKTLRDRVEDLGRHGYHPLDPDAGSYLNGVLGSLGGGEFSASPEEHVAEDETPRIIRDPVVFVRLRTLGLASTVRSILEDIEKTTEFPPSITRIVGGDAVTVSDPGTTEGGTSDIKVANEDEQVLFVSEANLEQLNIAKRLAKSGAVLVQGPPGTGKTHTIANLIGHLLAQGKSILVSSHTTKALRVLRDKVHPELQPLCVSVLDSDARGRQELEISVSKISERLSTNNADELHGIAATREADRAETLKKLAQAREELRQAVGAEYREIVVAGRSHDPAQAARVVADGRGRHDWILPTVTRGAALPLSEGELAKLYGSNAVLSADEETQLHLRVPAPAELLSPVQFKEAVEGLARHRPQAQKLREELWRDPDQPLDTRELGRYLEALEKALEFIGVEGEIWRVHAAHAGLMGGHETASWTSLTALIKEVRETCSKGANLLLQHGPQLANPRSEDLDTVKEILAHLDKGGSIGFLQLIVRTHWKTLINTAKVAERAPTEVEHFEALRAHIDITLRRRELVARWTRQMVPLGAPAPEQLGGEPERICAQFIDRIEDALQWHQELLQPAVLGLQAMGLQWDRLLREVQPIPDVIGELHRLEHAVRNYLQPVVRARLARQFVRQYEGELEKLRGALAQYPADHHGAVNGLVQALRGHDVRAYERHFAEIAELDAKRRTLSERLELLARLEKHAPGWASAVRNRQPPHDKTVLPGDAGQAWLWRQLSDELQDRQNQSPAEIQARIEDLSEKLRNVTVELIEARAWANQLEKASKYRQSLIGWLDTQRRLGARTGKKTRIAELLSQARRLMAESQAAVPVWIMPLVRVYENFDPRRGKFDVVIIDEASQCGLEGLVALYLGKQVVIVGDHEQVSPESVGTEQAPIDNLIKMTLTGIPNAHLYDGKLSVYDLGRQAFGETVRLVEHFRCVPAIIQFSNHLSYNNEIKPLREATAGSLEPSVVPYRVAGSRTGKVNDAEAEAIVGLIEAMCAHERYKDRTIGVVSLLADDQAIHIDRLLRNRIAPAEYERRRIVCGNASHFQGDERDVMFLSVVDGPNDDDSPLASRQAGANDMWKKRYNVAASRARDQLWVVHSLDPKTNLKPGDLRRRLIEHALDPAALLRELEQGLSRTESEFERKVLAALVSRGYKVKPQWAVGKYRIDLVVEGEKKRLAIECDGDRYHPIDKIPNDMARQAVLERLGWKFVRIRGSEFFLDAEQALRSVWRRLDELGIAPRASEEAAPGAAPPSLLIDELTRLAQDLRQRAAG